MNMTRTVIGSIVFTVAVLVLIDFIGDILVGQTKTDIAVDTGQAIIRAKPETAPQPAVAPAPAAEPPATVMAEAPAAAGMAAGNVKVGEDQFRKKCMGCHPASPDGVNRTGPNLFGVIGRNKASASGFRYSAALLKLGGAWTEAELATFISGPRTMVPDTKMTFAGVKKEDQRIDIIAYLRTLKN